MKTTAVDEKITGSETERSPRNLEQLNKMVKVNEKSF